MDAVKVDFDEYMLLQELKKDDFKISITEDGLIGFIRLNPKGDDNVKKSKEQRV